MRFALPPVGTRPALRPDRERPRNRRPMALERARGAARDLRLHRFGGRRLRTNPSLAPDVEDVRQSPDAVARMDAELGVERHRDPRSLINLKAPAHRSSSRGDATG